MQMSFKTFLSQLSQTNATLDGFVDFEKVTVGNEINRGAKNRIKRSKFLRNSPAAKVLLGDRVSENLLTI